MYFDSILVVAGDSDHLGKQKSIINHSGIDAYAFDQSFGFEMDRNRRKEGVSESLKDPKQRPNRRSIVVVLRGGRFLKSKNQINNSLNICDMEK